MDNTLKEVFKSFNPVLEYINSQLKNVIIPQNLDLFNNKDFSEKTYVIIKNHLNSILSDNKNYTFIAFDNVNCLMLRCSNNICAISFKLECTPTPELCINNIFFKRKINKNGNGLSISFSISSDLYFNVGMSSDNDSFDIFFDDKHLIGKAEENNTKSVHCSYLIPYFEKYKTLFKLFQSESEAVSELLLKNKKFTNQQNDLFKLLYDFEVFDTEELSINFKSDIINKLEIKHKQTKKIKNN